MKTKNCCICQQSINLEKDSYVHLIDYKKGKFFVEGYYHNKCWNEKFNVARQVKGRVFGLLDKAENLLGIKKEDTYEIR